MDQKRIDRFWSRIKKAGPDDCWEWQRHLHRDGHGQVWWNGKMQYAHRIAYELTKGETPKNTSVLHSCDNPPCCNPAHLFAGTQFDNMQDKEAKGRGAKGEKHGQHKLTQTQVDEIRARYAAGGISYSKLGKEFGVSQSQIEVIVNHKQWK